VVGAAWSFADPPAEAGERDDLLCGDDAHFLASLAHGRVRFARLDEAVY